MTPPMAKNLFVMYWIAFKALYGRVNETGHGSYLRDGSDDARWSLRRICELDVGVGRLGLALAALR